jgi:CHAD domain-containing protein
MAFRIRRKERVDEAVRRIVRAQLRAAIRIARAEAETASQEDRVHEVRTRLKRARAALAQVRQAGRSAARDDRRLRDIAKRLARPRDLAVQAHTFRVLGTRLPAEVPEDVVRQLGRVERQIRHTLAADEVERELRRSARALRKARRRLHPWRVSGSRRAAGDAITRTYRKARRAMRAAATEPTPERFHDWRKQVKRLWYQLRIVRGAVPELATTLIPKVERLAELLGQIHDLDCAKATIELHPEWLGRAQDRQAVPGLLDERRGAYERDALALAEAVFAGRVRDVRELVEVGWRIWRHGSGETAADADDGHAPAGGERGRRAHGAVRAA